MRLTSYTYNELTIYENDLITDNDLKLVMVRLILQLTPNVYVFSNNSDGNSNLSGATDFIDFYAPYFESKVTIPPYSGDTLPTPTPTPTMTPTPSLMV